MMKLVIVVTVLLAATEIFSVLGAGETEEDCSKLTNETKCCAGCIYITCQNKTANETLKGCHAAGWDNSTVCNTTTVVNTCPTSGGSTTPTPQPVHECKDLSTNDTCCANDKCKYISCKDKTDATTTHIGCHLTDDDLKEVCDGNATILCENGTTPTTTVAPSVASTAAPDVCEKNADKGTCCDATDDNCIYIKCSDTDDKPHEGCHVNSTDFSTVCKNPDDKVNTCKATTTKAPTTQPPATSPAATDACEAFTTQEDCCAKKTDLGCNYISCTMADSSKHEGCHNKDAHVTSVCTDTPVDQCPSSTTAQPGSSTPEAPPAGDAAASKEPGQRFDGASFIGGIVLCAGLVAIIFFGLKCYKARTERNYHTL